MSGANFLLGAALLGIGLVRRFLSVSLNSAEQVLWGLVIGWSGATAVGYAFIRLAGGLTFRAALFVTLFVWAATLICWLPGILRGDKAVRFVWDKAFTPLCLVLCVVTPIYLRLFVTHMLQVHADSGIYSGGESTAYDMAFHAAITTSFAYGGNFPAVYTPMPPAPLLYPFLPDFLTALLVVLGMDLHSALVSTAIPLCLALTGLFYFFAFRVLKLSKQSRLTEVHLGWIAATATLLFLFNGGFGFLYLFQDWRASGTTLWHFLATLDVNYSHIADKGLVWPNVITDMLLPQRTSIFGLSLGFIILTSFAISWQGLDDASGRSGWSNWPILLSAGILAGLLPFFHIHSYAAVGLISGFLFLLRPRKVWLVFWAAAVVLALPRLLELGGSLAGTGFVRLQPGWRGQGEQSWLLFWLRNVGLPTLLIIPAWFTAPKSLRRFYFGFFALLVLTLLLVFSPNDYDNLKLMAYWYAGTCVVIACWLGRLAVTRLGRLVFIVLIIVSCTSGLFAILYEWQTTKLVFGRDEVAVAAFVKSQTAPHSLFLTAPSLHNPVLSLAGRAVVRGPTAWLWSHGYPFAEREADVRAIYRGRDDARELLRYYRVDYVYLGPNETTELGANRAFFDANFPTVYRAGEIAIYDSRKPGDDDRRASGAYPPREYASRIDRDPSQILTEFPAVAFELFRLRKAAFDGLPRYADFMSDLRILGRELYPGSPGWREVLEKNKRTLWEQWAARPDFKQRNKSLSDIRSATKADYNAAYVLCHYFAYLCRNPDDLPDHDLTGYDFWRTQLDRNSDYRGLTRAFIEAEEYKKQDR